MGVLDDAIRDHLELKRRRGADPGEVEKQASEALGPARREPPAEPLVEPAEDEVAEVLPEAGEPLPEAAPSDLPDVPETADALPEVPDVPEAEPPTQPAEERVPPPAPVEEEPAADVTPLHPADDSEIFPEAPPPEPPATGPVEDPAGEHPASDEGDRLWFEQRPRSDFDFDE